MTRDQKKALRWAVKCAGLFLELTERQYPKEILCELKHKLSRAKLVVDTLPPGDVPLSQILYRNARCWLIESGYDHEPHKDGRTLIVRVGNAAILWLPSKKSWVSYPAGMLGGIVHRFKGTQPEFAVFCRTWNITLQGGCK